MSYSKNYGGYQSTSGGDSSSDFSRFSQTIASNVQKVSQNVNSMQRMVNQLGTAQDSENLRNQLHQLQHYTNQLAKDTNNSLKEIAQLPQPTSLSDQRQRKMLRDRLTNDFSEALKNFQVIQRTAAQKEKESVIRARAHSKISGSHEDDQQPSNLIDLASPSAQMQATLQMEEEVNLRELQEREDSIRKIETDIVEVNTIFKDLASLVHEQGEVIDSIEANVESASIQVTEGAQQIMKARDYQAKARRKTCLLTLIFASVAFFIIFVIWLSK